LSYLSIADRLNSEYIINNSNSNKIVLSGFIYTSHDIILEDGNIDNVYLCYMRRQREVWEDSRPDNPGDSQNLCHMFL